MFWHCWSRTWIGEHEPGQDRLKQVAPLRVGLKSLQAKAHDARGMYAVGRLAGAYLRGGLIHEINGQPVSQWTDIRTRLADSGTKPVPFEIQRDKEMLTVTVTPVLNPETGKPFIGVVSSLKKVQLTPWQAAVSSVTATKNIIKNMYASLYHMVTGKTKAELSGPVGVAKMAGQVAHKGFDMLLQFTAMLSLNLAIINLLPLPALDGGHFLILLIEAVTGHKLGKTAMQNIQKVGVAMILAITIFATFKDLTR